MSDKTAYQLKCNHVTRDIKDFDKCPNCDMHTLLNACDVYQNKIYELQLKIDQFEKQEKELKEISGLSSELYSRIKGRRNE